jgi:hypothetical protein
MKYVLKLEVGVLQKIAQGRLRSGVVVFFRKFRN